MIKLEAKLPQNETWNRLSQQATVKRAWLLEMYAANQPIEISDSLYKALGRAFFAETTVKCAYCENEFRLSQAGDVEHFRPKGRVTDENDQVIFIGTDQARRPHPGYFWLAYDWTNLLPSCWKCNRPARTTDGRLVGKSTRFPVFGRHADPVNFSVMDTPLLINPFEDDPSDHLDMDLKTGILFKKTVRGAMSIKLLDLNREGLPEARRRVYDYVLMRAGIFHAALLRGDEDEIARSETDLLSYKTGRAEYSMAGRKALHVYEQAVSRQSNLFR